ncbi:hypothetical protein Rsub_11030 [Raphidocelis subcapitata]|uniref:Iron-sulfur cluster biosynthesis family n=1 Tax=Raphidocelis subcapitata TaxID=307507 RepID=A0A2V0PHI3_9CHLO|nr:hypothetical protein Rsub_11030 [Raphidocelis subcapitata]|eukprot:GBF97383.1 hypothetical protein Rsub_11030 [Raphidocelis subcapitata]
MQTAAAAPGLRAGALAGWPRPRRLAPPLAAHAQRPARPPLPRPAAPAARPSPAPAPARGPAPPRAALPRSPSGAFDPLRDFQRELGMQSNRLDPDIRERVEGAIEALGWRATVGEVAARAGVKLSEADGALKALAYDSLGHLEVSKDGEVVYSFDRGFKAKLRNRSALQRLRPVLKKAQAVGAYLVRVAFGGALIASVLVVWLAIAVLTSSRDGDRRDRGGGGYYGGGGYGGGGGIWLNPLDLWLWADPSYARHTRERIDSGREMNFVEGIFSWVFGDGDPNMTYQERRWRALGKHIQRLGGVVSAEEMAPFLDPPELPDRLPQGPNKYEDEAFVLPALLRFGGEPFVDERGGLLYRFPALQVGASEAPAMQLRPQEARVPLEREWEFSAASPGQQAGAVALGAANIIGVIVLSSMLADPLTKLSLFRQGLGFVFGLLPALQAYAAAFFAIPLVRVFADARRNAKIGGRNDARLEALELLASGDRDLESKLTGARKLGSRRVIGRQEVIYTTETAADAQVNRAEEEEFDRKLGRQPKGGDGGARQLPRQAGGNKVDDVFGRGGKREREREPADGDDWRAGGRAGRRRDDWERMDRW